jgi:hypothetical protein
MVSCVLDVPIAGGFCATVVELNPASIRRISCTVNIYTENQT